MSKPKRTVGQWLNDVFGLSHKSISENLSTEQYNQFVAEASKLQSADDSEEEESEEESEEEQETGEGKKAENASLESRVQALESSLKATQANLKAETKAKNNALKQLEETQGKLQQSEDQKKKLRDAVNPLGDEDITNSESQPHLTNADIEARKSYKQNRSED